MATNVNEKNSANKHISTVVGSNGDVAVVDDRLRFSNKQMLLAAAASFLAGWVTTDLLNLDVLNKKPDHKGDLDEAAEKELKDALAASETALKMQITALNEKEALLTRKGMELEHQNELIADKDAQLATLSAEIEGLRATKGQLAEALNTIKELNKELSEHPGHTSDEEVDKLRAQISKLQTDYAGLIGHHADADFDRIVAEKAELDSKYQHVEEKLAELRAAYAGLVGHHSDEEFENLRQRMEENMRGYEQAKTVIEAELAALKAHTMNLVGHHTDTDFDALNAAKIALEAELAKLRAKEAEFVGHHTDDEFNHLQVAKASIEAAKERLETEVHNLRTRFEGLVGHHPDNEFDAQSQALADAQHELSELRKRTEGFETRANEIRQASQRDRVRFERQTPISKTVQSFYYNDLEAIKEQCGLRGFTPRINEYNVVKGADTFDFEIELHRHGDIIIGFNFKKFNFNGKAVTKGSEEAKMLLERAIVTRDKIQGLKTATAVGTPNIMNVAENTFYDVPYVDRPSQVWGNKTNVTNADACRYYRYLCALGVFAACDQGTGYEFSQTTSTQAKIRGLATLGITPYVSFEGAEIVVADGPDVTHQIASLIMRGAFTKHVVKFSA